MGTHPELPERVDALLCSINDGVRALAFAATGEEHGRKIAPLGRGWVSDVVRILLARSESRARTAAMNGSDV